MPFYNNKALVEIDGPVELIGPSMADINGGMGGIYIRSTGAEGKASVKISLPDHDVSSEVMFDIVTAD